MPLWFHLVFESQRRTTCPFGFNRRRAPGLDHDYGQITTTLVLLGVQVADVRRGYLGGRRRRRVPAPAPASPGAGAGAGAGIYIMTMARSQPL